VNAMTPTKSAAPPKQIGNGHTGRGGDGWDGNGGDQHESASPLGKRIGLWIFIGVASVLFSALISAYVVRMGLSDWHPLPEPWWLWANTATLVLASVLLQWGLNAAKQGNLSTTRNGVLLGGVFGALFITGQLWAWQQFMSLGYFVESNPANTFFYLMTALHGLHMLGGLVAWIRTYRTVQRNESATKVVLGVEMCTVYWHFLLVVWLVLFGLMLLT